MKKTDTKLTARGQIPVLGGYALTWFMLLGLGEPAFRGLHLHRQKGREGREGAADTRFTVPVQCSR